MKPPNEIWAHELRDDFSVTPEGRYNVHYLLAGPAEAETARLKAENAEWECSFALFDNAIERGTKMYHEKHPEDTHVLPDTGKLLLGLLEEHARLKAVLARIADWPYDIMGDCVAEARKEATDAIKGGE